MKRFIAILVGGAVFLSMLATFWPQSAIAVGDPSPAANAEDQLIIDKALVHDRVSTMKPLFISLGEAAPAHFASTTKVSVYIDAEDSPIASFASDTAGQLFAQISVQAFSTGSHTIYLKGNDPTGQPLTVYKRFELLDTTDPTILYAQAGNLTSSTPN